MLSSCLSIWNGTNTSYVFKHLNKTLYATNSILITHIHINSTNINLDGRLADDDGVLWLWLQVAEPKTQ